jgi:transcriptional regulator with XRE-family HTH domain
MTDNQTQNLSFSEAWQKGTEIGHDITQARMDQRQLTAQRVKALRNKRGISQEKISDLIHANTLTYRGYENCKSDIPLFYLVRIADVLETSLDYLAGRTEAQEESILEQRVKKLEEAVQEIRSALENA